MFLYRYQPKHVEYERLRTRMSLAFSVQKIKLHIVQEPILGKQLHPHPIIQEQAPLNAFGCLYSNCLKAAVAQSAWRSQ